MGGLLLSACSALEGPAYGVYDPYESSNRTLYDVTDTVDQAVMIPVAKGYDVVVPNALQQGVLNVFQNLRGVGSGINGFLQGKPKAGLTDLTRVVINSTFGVGGLFDLASRAGLQNQDEDFGQTLAVWGVKRSRYIYFPFLGPSTIRDLPSALFRGAVPGLILGRSYHWSVTVVDVVSSRANLLTATGVRDASAIDPYAFTRDAFYQRRQFQIYDGSPPLDAFFDDFEDLDGFDEPYEEQESAALDE